MTGRAVVPLIDLVFLTLGSVLAVMTQMEHVQALDVEVAKVGKGASTVQRGELTIVAITADGLNVNGTDTDLDGALAKVRGKRVILRAPRRLPTQRTLEVLAELARHAAKVSVEVDPQPTPKQLADRR